MMKRLLLTLSLVLTVAWTSSGQVDAEGEGEKKPPKITYDDHVKPILRSQCFTCHNTDRKRGGLDMTTYTSLMEGGSSGKVIEPGESAQSRLYALITHQQKPEMPPRSPKLPDELLETIRKWIDGGVLENTGSKAVLPEKKTIDLVVKNASERPKEPAMPGGLPLEPVIRTQRMTAVTALATSPWAPLAAVGGQKQVVLYHTKTLEMLGILPFPEGVPEVLKFSRNGSLLLAGGGRGGASGKVVVWNVKTGERVLEVGDELDTVLAADISADHGLIALGGPQRVVRIYSTRDGRLLHELRKHTDWIYSVAFSPDGVLLATADRNGGLFVWEAYTGREYLNLKGHNQGILGLSWRADSNVLASGSEDGTIRLWEMENGGQVRSWGAHGGGVADVEFARDGRILSCGRDRLAKLWDQGGKQLRAFPAFSDIALKVTFCDETNQAIAGDWTGAIRVWNAADGKAVGELTSNPPTLAERLDTAQKELTTRQATYNQLAGGATAAKAAADKAAADLAAAQKAVTDTANAAKEAQTQFQQAQQTLTQVQGALAKAQGDVRARTLYAQALAEAAAKVKTAADQAKEDAALAQVAAKAQALAETASNELKQAQEEEVKQAQAVKADEGVVATAQQKVTATTTAAAEAPKRVTALTAVVKQAQEKAVAEQAKAEQAKAALAEAEAAVAKWKAAETVVSKK